MTLAQRFLGSYQLTGSGQPSSTLQPLGLIKLNDDSSRSFDFHKETPAEFVDVNEFLIFPSQVSLKANILPIDNLFFDLLDSIKSMGNGERDISTMVKLIKKFQNDNAYGDDCVHRDDVHSEDWSDHYEYDDDWSDYYEDYWEWDYDDLKWIRS
ncbi:hypothetical protein F2Q69_00049407 [Brassica cretica]|uniref:Uncharacterized protein n=1 Tax=Brassica cretica TaxID=69181 RepID=A0A8S9Q207_BRACR|nr:hypothetical protein F2Q69_00049407 [Brassica cretica]